MINDVGVTTIKKTIPITIGDIIVPNKIPNLNQILFKGVKIEEFNKPKIKKITARIIVKIFILSSLNKGNNEIIKKNMKKTSPKLLLEDIFGLFTCIFFLLLSQI